MTTFDMDSNAAEVAGALVAVGVRAGARAFAITRHHGQLLQTTVKRRASLPRSGPPGPRLQTGDYARSINLRMETGAGTIAAVVGTNRPQGRRLEYGFTGVDALGRRYHQPPYPHFRPALFEIEGPFLAAMAAVVTFDA